MFYDSPEILWNVKGMSGDDAWRPASLQLFAKEICHWHRY